MTATALAMPKEETSTGRRTSLKRIAPVVGGFALLFALAAGSIYFVSSSHRVAEAMTHTLQMRSKGYRLLTILQDAETGQRGYLISNDRYYLRPYDAALEAAPKAIAELTALSADNPQQTETVHRLKTLIEGKLAELARTIALIDKGDSADAIAVVKSNKGNHFMASIREEIAQFQAEEERVQQLQRAASERANFWLAVASIAAAATIVLLAVQVILTTRRDTKALLGAQASLRDTNENLERLVAERVSELQIANEEIQRFAYIVSHDLRAPLVNVMGFTSELESAGKEIGRFLKEIEAKDPGLVSEDGRIAIETDLPESLSFIRASTAKMDRLINAILKLSREGRRVLTPQPIDLVELVETQGKSLSQQFDAGKAKLEVQTDLPGLVSDRLAIEQIFGNLIENAVKYLDLSRAGLIKVTGREHGAYRRYDIADNGRGIEAKDYERIFELFRRSGEQDKPGEGIGLAYVRNLARRLGGNVTVQSEFGRGSTFTVMLPAVYSSNARSGR